MLPETRALQHYRTRGVNMDAQNTLGWTSWPWTLIPRDIVGGWGGANSFNCNNYDCSASRHANKTTIILKILTILTQHTISLTSPKFVSCLVDYTTEPSVLIFCVVTSRHDGEVCVSVDLLGCDITIQRRSLCQCRSSGLWHHDTMGKFVPSVDLLGCDITTLRIIMCQFWSSGLWHHDTTENSVPVLIFWVVTSRYNG
jgi:hypothetical protein